MVVACGWSCTPTSNPAMCLLGPSGALHAALGIDRGLDSSRHAVLRERRHELPIAGEHRARPEHATVPRVTRLLRDEHPLADVAVVVEVRGVRDDPGRDRAVRIA